MIKQITKFDLKFMLSRPSAREILVATDGENDMFMVTSYQRDGEEVLVEDLPSIGFVEAIQSSKTYYHMVKEVDQIVNQSFGDDNAKDFIQLVQLIWYSTGHKERGWLGEMMDLYKVEFDTATFALNEMEDALSQVE